MGSKKQITTAPVEDVIKIVSQEAHDENAENMGDMNSENTENAIPAPRKKPSVAKPSLAVTNTKWFALKLIRPRCMTHLLPLN